MNPHVAHSRLISGKISVVIFLSGLAVLIGWVFDITVLKSVFPNLISMKANAAICFILTGAALWCLQTKRVDSFIPRLISALCLSFLLLIGLLTFCEYIYHWNIGIDQLLVKEPAGAVLTIFPGRMSFHAAYNFFLIGIILIFAKRKEKPFIYGGQCLALVIGYISLSYFIGYIYGVKPLNLSETLSTGMALHTSILFILTSFAILTIRPDIGPMAEVHSEMSGGRILRWLLPMAILAPICMGYFKIYSQRTHLFGDEFGVSLVAMGNLTIIILYIYFLSVMLNRADIKRKALEDSTIETRDRLEKIINAVADPIFVKDRKHRWILLNTAYSSFMGRKPEDILGKSDYEFFTKDQADVFWENDEEVLSKGKEVLNEGVFKNGNGDLKAMSIKKTLYSDNYGNRYIVGIIRDMTRQKQVQEKIEIQSKALEESLKEANKARRIMTSMLDDNNKIREDLENRLVELKRSQNMMIHSEKLASLGRLVSEITHEINNPLMIISGYAQLSLMSTTLSDEERNNLKIIVQECQRAKDVTKRILRFSRLSRGEVKKVDISQCIEAVVSIVEKQFVLNYNVQIVKQYSDQVIFVSLDEQQMHEVFMNLLNNAKESMPNGGVITIITSVQDQYLKIDFKDTGIGMSEDVLRKVVEPFFTTKETGTGIGLDVCYGIVKAHSGDLRFESELGKGTVATILLPLMGDM